MVTKSRPEIISVPHPEHICRIWGGLGTPTRSNGPCHEHTSGDKAVYPEVTARHPAFGIFHQPCVTFHW